ncbi:MAG: hypothetical protein WA005_11175 [Candidatus Binataceae bacterium]
MQREEVKRRLCNALREVNEKDAILLEYDVSERCIASRLAMYLQARFPGHSVDVEYNRDGGEPKRLNLPGECANRWDRYGSSLVVPDVVLHRRGRGGANLLVLELKKLGDPDALECDSKRVRAFRHTFGYTFGALIGCETRKGHTPRVALSKWFDDQEP